MSSTKKVQNSTKKYSFPEGHKKYGGRKKGTPNKSSMGVKTKLEEKGIDIVDEFLEIFKTTDDDVLKVNILKELCKYTYPQLKATDLNIENAGAVVEKVYVTKEQDKATDKYIDEILNEK